MGGAGSKCCGGGGGTPKDKDDKYMDEVVYEALGVSKVDDVLSPAFDMLNTVVSVNNTLWQSVDAVKTIGSILMGSMEAKLVVSESMVKFIIVKEDDAGEPMEVAEVLGGSGAETIQQKIEPDFKKITDAPDALTAVEGASTQLGSLNEVLKEASMVGVTDSGNRLKVVMGDVGDDAEGKKKSADAKAAIASFNNSYFKVKMQLIKMEMAGGLSQALSELVTNIKKVVEDVKPSLEMDFAALTEGNLVITPSLGISPQKLANAVPKKVKKVLEVLFGKEFLTTGDPLSEGGLLHALIDTAKQCFELMSKFSEMKEKITELTSDLSGLKDEAIAAGMDTMTAMKFPGKVTANAKTAMKTPLVLAELFKTIKAVGGEIKSGLTGAPAEPAAE